MPTFVVTAEVRSFDTYPEVFEGFVSLRVDSLDLGKALEDGAQLLDEMLNWNYVIIRIDKELEEN